MKKAAHNSTYPQVAVQWLNQALCPPKADFCLVDSEELRNRHLRVAAKRWATLPLTSHWHGISIVLKEPNPWNFTHSLHSSLTLKATLSFRRGETRSEVNGID